MEELEDDYNAAWEVLDVARTIYQKIVDGLKEGEGNKERTLLSDCYLALGNVSCETGTPFFFYFIFFGSFISVKPNTLPSLKLADLELGRWLTQVLFLLVE